MQSLGSTLREYGINRGEVRRRLGLAAASFTMMGSLIYLLIAERYAPDLIFVGMLLIMGGYGLQMLISVSMTYLRKPRLNIHECGVSLTTRRGTQSWRWDEFTEYKGWLAAWKMSGVFTLMRDGAHHFYVGNRRVFSLTFLTENPVEAYSVVVNYITNAMLPEATAVFDEGGTLSFGSVTLNRDRLTIGKNMYPVRDIASAEIRGNLIVVRRFFSKSNLLIPHEQLPNRELLESMLCYAAQRQRSAATAA